MDKIPALWFAVFAGLCFGGWPLIMKLSGLNPIVAATVLAVASLAVFLPFLKGNVNIAELTATGVVIALIAGVINGLGSIAIQRVLASPVEVTTGILVIIITQVVVTAIGGRLFYHETFTVNKAVGLLAAVAAIKLLTGK